MPQSKDIIGDSIFFFTVIIKNPNWAHKTGRTEQDLQKSTKVEKFILLNILRV